MFLLVPAYLGCPGQTAVKWLLLLLPIYTKDAAVDVQPCYILIRALCYIYARREKVGVS